MGFHGLVVNRRPHVKKKRWPMRTANEKSPRPGHSSAPLSLSLSLSLSLVQNHDESDSPGLPSLFSYRSYEVSIYDLDHIIR